MNKINTILLTGSFCANAEGLKTDHTKKTISITYPSLVGIIPFKTYPITKTTANININVPNIVGVFTINDFSLTVPFFLICFFNKKRNKNEKTAPEISVNIKYNIFPSNNLYLFD